MTTGPAPNLDHETVVARVRSALAALTEGLDSNATDEDVVRAVAERLIEAGVTDATSGGSDCPLAKYLRAELAPERVGISVSTNNVQVTWGDESSVELSPALEAFVMAFDRMECTCSHCGGRGILPGLAPLFRTLRGLPESEDGEVSE